MSVLKTLIFLAGEVYSKNTRKVKKSEKQSKKSEKVETLQIKTLQKIWRREGIIFQSANEHHALESYIYTRKFLQVVMVQPINGVR